MSYRLCEQRRIGTPSTLFLVYPPNNDSIRLACAVLDTIPGPLVNKKISRAINYLLELFEDQTVESSSLCGFVQDYCGSIVRLLQSRSVELAGPILALLAQIFPRIDEAARRQFAPVLLMETVHFCADSTPIMRLAQRIFLASVSSATDGINQLVAALHDASKPVQQKQGVIRVLLEHMRVNRDAMLDQMQRELLQSVASVLSVEPELETMDIWVELEAMVSVILGGDVADRVFGNGDAQGSDTDAQSDVSSGDLDKAGKDFNSSPPLSPTWTDFSDASVHTLIADCSPNADEFLLENLEDWSLEKMSDGQSWRHMQTDDHSDDQSDTDSASTCESSSGMDTKYLGDNLKFGPEFGTYAMPEMERLHPDQLQAFLDDVEKHMPWPLSPIDEEPTQAVEEESEDPEEEQASAAVEQWLSVKHCRRNSQTLSESFRRSLSSRIAFCEDEDSSPSLPPLSDHLLQAFHLTALCV